MNLYLKKKQKMSIGSIIIALIIITCVTPREITLYAFSTSRITRPYGAGFTISLPMFLVAVTTVLRLQRSARISKSLFRTPVMQYLNWGIVSCIFIAFNGASMRWYTVGAFKYFMFACMFILISTLVSYDDLMKGVDKGFRLSLLIQTTVGILYVFFGIFIPYVSNYSTSVRNGLSRMVGSFSHPGDFSLYISILYIYFLVRWLFVGEKKSILYVILGFVDIYLSGARTMLIVTASASIIVLMRRYRKRLDLKLLLVLVAALGIYWFIQSDMFQDLFIIHNFFDMLTARFVHWTIGLKIIFANVGNFLFGVGLNYHVDYIDMHFENYEKLIYTASQILTSDFVRGMPVHNSFLIAGCELGVVGFVLYLRIYLYMVLSSIQDLKSRKNSIRVQWKSFFILGAAVVLFLYCVQGWATHKDFSWTMIIILSVLVYQMSKQKEG